MEDRSKELYRALAEVGARQKHGEECQKAIKRRADAWLSNTIRASKRLDPDSEAQAVDDSYNGVARLNFARAQGILRGIRDRE